MEAVMNNKYKCGVAMVWFLSSFLALSASGATGVSDVVWSQEDDTRQVTCTYTLSGDSAVVNADVLVDGEPIEARYHGYFIGDVNRIVSAGTSRRFYWRPDKAWPGDPRSVTFRLRVASPSNAPEYMVVDLDGGLLGDVRYYADSGLLPHGGLTNDIYRSSCLVLKRIPAAGVVWNMGSPDSEPNRENQEVLHRVLLTKDYWMSVFEITQAQFQLIAGRNPSYSANVGPYKPVDNVFGTIRDKNARTSGDEKVSGGAFRTAVPVGESFLGILREKSGLDFDLPTEAQWEYACRAGTASSYNSGSDKLPVNEYGNFSDYNGYSTDEASGECLLRVGSLKPNAWGLYDMHGNVYEWCLDSYNAVNYGFSSLDSVLTDPLNTTDGASMERQRVRRGGTYRSSSGSGRSASRFYWYEPYRGTGFRVVCTGFVNP